MVRPFLSLWPICLWICPWLVLLGVFLSEAEPLVASLPVAVLLASPFVWWLRWLGPFCGQIGQFRTITSRDIILHCSPEVGQRWDCSELLQRCQAELDDLKKWFGFPLRRRAVIFVFPNYRTIQRTFGRKCGALALPLLNAIVVPDELNLEELIRHELAHLFSARWNRMAVPMLNEGLSTCLQGTFLGRPIDALARALLANPNRKFGRLLNQKFFFSRSHIHVCYILAGSFSRFLIRRYGWERYRRFYRRCYGPRFRAQFTRCFGVTLEKAEWQWRTELQVMEVLNRRRKSYLGF